MGKEVQLNVVFRILWMKTGGFGLDAVHIIKCVRNFFHDRVTVLYGNIVSYKFFRLVYKLDTSAENTGRRTCPKVTAAHLDPLSFQRMNARLVFKLFSNSMANTIKF